MDDINAFWREGLRFRLMSNAPVVDPYGNKRVPTPLFPEIILGKKISIVVYRGIWRHVRLAVSCRVLERIATDHSSCAHDDKLRLAQVWPTDRQFDS